MADPIRIAVIDSGVQPGHPHILAENLDPGFAVGRDGTITSGREFTQDRLGHGTAVMAAIQQWAPMARCTPVRVFDEALRASPCALVTAIGHCVDAGFDLINQSLGTTNAAHRDVFETVARLARDAGVVLVAPRDVDGTPCFPGALPDVLGVGLNWDCLRETCIPARAGFHASGHPRPIDGVPQRRNLHGVSFAVANVTGFAAHTLAGAGEIPKGRARLDALCALLRAG
jgi:hypothetical protein